MIKNSSKYRNRQFRRSKKQTQLRDFCNLDDLFERIEYKNAKIEKEIRSFFKSDEEYEKFSQQMQEISKSRKI